MLSHNKIVRFGLIAATATAALFASSAAHAELVYGLTTSNAVFSVDSANVNNISLSNYQGLVGFTGFAEQAISIDARPINGGGLTLLTVGQTSGTNSAIVARLYDVNAVTGAITNSRIITGTGVTFNTTAAYTIDYNPTGTAALRILGSDGSNYRVTDPTLGTSVADTALNGAATTGVVGAAYINNIPGATSTALYDINTNNSTLVQQGLPTSGTLTTVGGFGVTLDNAGFHELDVSSVTGTMFGAFQLNGESFSRFYTVDTATGGATATTGNNIFRVADTNSAINVRGISVAAVVPEAGTLALIAPVLGVLGAVVVRRRKLA